MRPLPCPGIAQSSWDHLRVPSCGPRLFQQPVASIGGGGESKVPEVLPRRHPTSRFLGSWASAPSAQHPFVESLSEPQLGPEEQGMR